MNQGEFEDQLRADGFQEIELVELVSRPQPWVRAKPARTITVRAQKSDLDAFVSGTTALPKQTVSFSLGRINDTVITSAMPVFAFKAIDWLDADATVNDSLTAPSLTGLLITGATGGIAGDFNAADHHPHELSRTRDRRRCSESQQPAPDCARAHRVRTGGLFAGMHPCRHDGRAAVGLHAQVPQSRRRVRV